MKFSKMERQVIFAFGDESRTATVKRIGIVCSCITDNQLKQVLVALHNKLRELVTNDDKWFSEQFRSITEEMERDFNEYNKIASRFIEQIEI